MTRRLVERATSVVLDVLEALRRRWLELGCVRRGHHTYDGWHPTCRRCGTRTPQFWEQ